MGLRLYNTLARSLEDFVPLEDGRVRMYTCGPTVYDHAHIGNFRTFLFDDLLRRYLEWKGYEVVQVRNLTDVDDKTIRAALEAGVRLREYTEPFVQAFFEDSDRLGLERAEHYPRATEHVPKMVALIGRLQERGLTYVADGSVYFDISKFPEYGRLAQIDLSGLKDGARVSGDESYEKEDARDFVLWKGGGRAQEGDVAVWQSPWGPGRPGWHLECSVMALSYLGDSFDIHSGGIDLIFPHHTNELAQAEGATGRRFARYWLHAAHLLVDGRRMAKSAGNFYTVADLFDRGYPASAIRRVLVSGHYRAELNFTLGGLEDAGRSLQRVLELRRRLEAARTEDAEQPKTKLSQLAAQALDSFERALDDDLNVAEAWGALFVLVREANAELDRAGQRVPAAAADAVLDAITSMDRVFGVLSLAEREEEPVPEELRRWIEQQLEERAQARQAGDYAQADRIREALAEAGVEVDDTSSGSRWRLAKNG